MSRITLAEFSFRTEEPSHNDIEIGNWCAHRLIVGCPLTPSLYGMPEDDVLFFSFFTCFFFFWVNRGLVLVSLLLFFSFLFFRYVKSPLVFESVNFCFTYHFYVSVSNFAHSLATPALAFSLPGNIAQPPSSMNPVRLYEDTSLRATRLVSISSED